MDNDELQMEENLENGKGLNESGSSSDVYGSHLDHQEDSDNMVSENNVEDESKEDATNPEDSVSSEFYWLMFYDEGETFV